MIDYFNFYCYLYIAFALGLLTGLYFLLRNKSKRTCNIVLFSLLLSSFILHFVKLAFNYYQDWMPWAIISITPENLCAVSALVFPWLYISNKKILKDYLFYMGVLSGLCATIYPMGAAGLNAFEFETVRFYYCHILIWVVPLLMVMLKLHTLDYRRILKVPFLIYLALCIILVNETVLTGAGFINADYLFSNAVRNASFIFGPSPEVSVLGKLFTALTPGVFTKVPVGANAGSVFYWPVVWMIIPVYVYFCVYAFLLALPFEHRHIRRDFFAGG